MNFNLDYGLLSNIVAVAALMIANTIFRIALSVKIGDFDFDELKRGILKYLLTLIGVALFYVAGELCPQASIEISGEIGLQDGCGDREHDTYRQFEDYIDVLHGSETKE